MPFKLAIPKLNSLNSSQKPLLESYLASREGQQNIYIYTYIASYSTETKQNCLVTIPRWKFSFLKIKILQLKIPVFYI